MNRKQEQEGNANQYVRLTQRELDDLPHYQKHLPVPPTLGKRWKRKYLGDWFMGEYVADAHRPVNRRVLNIVWRRIEPPVTA